jgi:hypothetical protein
LAVWPFKRRQEFAQEVDAEDDLDTREVAENDLDARRVAWEEFDKNFNPVDPRGGWTPPELAPPTRSSAPPQQEDPVLSTPANDLPPSEWEPGKQPTWRQELRWLWRDLRNWFKRSPTTDDLASGCADGCCALMIAIIPATVILTWSVLGSLMALVVWAAAFVVAHAVRYATGTQHRYPQSLVRDLRLTPVHGSTTPGSQT